MRNVGCLRSFAADLQSVRRTAPEEVAMTGVAVARPRALAVCGAVAPIVFTVAMIAASLQHPAYSHAKNFISELGATGAPGATVMNFAGFLPYGILMMAFAAAVHRGIRADAGGWLGPSLLALLRPRLCGSSHGTLRSGLPGGYPIRASSTALADRGCCLTDCCSRPIHALRADVERPGLAVARRRDTGVAGCIVADSGVERAGSLRRSAATTLAPAAICVDRTGGYAPSPCGR